VRYFFDTDTVSNLVRRAPSLSLVRRLASTQIADQATSSITLGELHFGARRTAGGGGELIARIEALLIGVTILPFDADAAVEYGQLRANLERAGTPMGDADTRIAAIALTNGLTVVTGNVRYFERVPGLLVENWLV
jgi:tRNA(fMet)-specific endonuclease VapC